MPPLDFRSVHDRIPLLGLSPPAPLPPDRALRESLPVAVVLLLWTVLSWVAFNPYVAWAARTAGAVTALGYVVVRGVHLGRGATPLVVADVPNVLGQTVRSALAPAVWFLVAVLVPVVEDLWGVLGLVGLFTSPGDDLVRVCALTGLATAALVVTAGATAAFDASQ
jgi:hypothetical protein